MNHNKAHTTLLPIVYHPTTLFLPAHSQSANGRLLLESNWGLTKRRAHAHTPLTRVLHINARGSELYDIKVNILAIQTPLLDK